MELKITDPLYAYDELIADIEAMILLGENVTLCGIPYVGKSRLLRKILYDNKLVSKSTFVAFKKDSAKATFVENSLEEIRNLYESGKRIFVIQYVDLDNEDNKTLFEALQHFRRGCVETPVFVFFLSTHPDLYSDLFENATMVYSNILYYKIDKIKHFDFVVKQNQMKFEVELNDKDLEYIKKKSGGISILIKVYIREFSQLKEPSLVEDSKLSPYLKSILSEMPDKELDALRDVHGSKKVSEFMLQHLQNEGIVDDELKICSLLLGNYLEVYSRDYDLQVYKENIYVNGNSKSHKFSTVEKKILSKLFDVELVTRDDISRISVGDDKYMEYSEAAIDKAISRLRSKLQSIGVARNYIKTSKGKGFYIEK